MENLRQIRRASTPAPALESAPRTAFSALEEEHWEVARTALNLAEAVERYINARDVEKFIGEDVVDMSLVRMKDALVRFRGAASRAV